ncbi:MAG: succinate dehydrogenase [Firmicutes bacterium]|nr:succinate dehydrogenase [Bacillota bacterium]
MKVRIDVLRQKNPLEKSYVQSFEYEYEDKSTTVAKALSDINKQDIIKDTEGQKADKIRWECSCMQKKCGACAMRINSLPSLACDKRLSELGNIIKLEPLKKFPVIADLTVDRSVMFEALKTAKVWFEKNAQPNERRTETVHEASRCLQCGCCLEICPNFAADMRFKGFAAAVPLTRLIAEASEDEKKRIFASYSMYFYEGCGKSLACRDICPAGIDSEFLMVNSNAAAIWKRKRR